MIEKMKTTTISYEKTMAFLFLLLQSTIAQLMICISCCLTKTRLKFLF